MCGSMNLSVICLKGSIQGADYKVMIEDETQGTVACTGKLCCSVPGTETFETALK